MTKKQKIKGLKELSTEVRARMKLSQRQMAGLMKCHNSYIALAETGLVVDPLEYLKRMKPFMTPKEQKDALGLLTANLLERWNE